MYTGKSFFAADGVVQRELVRGGPETAEAGTGQVSCRGFRKPWSRYVSLSLSQFVFLSQSVSLSFFLSLSHSLLPLFSVQSRSDLSTQAFPLINLSRFCCVLSNSIQHYQTVFCVSKVADATFTLHSSNFVNILLYIFLAT